MNFSRKWHQAAVRCDPSDKSAPFSPAVCLQIYYPRIMEDKFSPMLFLSWLKTPRKWVHVIPQFQSLRHHTLFWFRYVNAQKGSPPKHDSRSMREKIHHFLQLPGFLVKTSRGLELGRSIWSSIEISMTFNNSDISLVHLKPILSWNPNSHLSSGSPNSHTKQSCTT